MEAERRLTFDNLAFEYAQPRSGRGFVPSNRERPTDGGRLEWRTDELLSKSDFPFPFTSYSIATTMFHSLKALTPENTSRHLSRDLIKISAILS
jgi:hypothetical protein